MSHQPDDVTAKDAGGGFTPHSEGQFAMLCVDVVNLGTNVEQYQDKPPREVPKVALVFASGERHDKADGGEQFLKIVTVEMALSANEKANLRKFLESWRGKTYTPEQAEQGLPVTKLYAQPALVSIEHVLTRKARRFAKIASISPLPKAMPAPDKAILTEYERPKFFADRKTEYAAALTKHREANGGAPVPDAPNGDEGSDDDLPF